MPTDDMAADILAKPKAGALFKKHRRAILGSVKEDILSCTKCGYRVAGGEFDDSDNAMEEKIRYEAKWEVPDRKRFQMDLNSLIEDFQELTNAEVRELENP